MTISLGISSAIRFLLISAALLLGYACTPNDVSAPSTQPTPSTQSTETAPAPGTCIIFHDRIDAKYEWLIIAGPDETFFQKAEFPGYANRQWYVVPEDHRLDFPFRVNGNLTPPFGPGGPNFSRCKFSEDGRDQVQDYFADNTPALRDALAALEKQAAKSPLQKELPKWVSDREFLLPYLGLP